MDYLVVCFYCMLVLCFSISLTISISISGVKPCQLNVSCVPLETDKPLLLLIQLVNDLLPSQGHLQVSFCVKSARLYVMLIAL